MNDLLAGRRILVVEDEMMILMMIEDLLADLGCVSGQGLKLVVEQSFDAATLDVNLSGCDSYAIADALALRNVPFTFSTGYVGRSFRSDYRDRPVLRKPCRIAEFNRIFAMLIADASPVRARRN